MARQSNVRVGNEMRSPMGYILSRTKRLSEMLVLPNILWATQDLVTALDEWCAVNGVDRRNVSTSAKFMRGMTHVVFTFERE